MGIPLCDLEALPASKLAILLTLEIQTGGLQSALRVHFQLGLFQNNCSKSPENLFHLHNENRSAQLQSKTTQFNGKKLFQRDLYQGIDATMARSLALCSTGADC